MSTQSITVATCDRCKTTEQFNRPEDGYHWAGLNYSETNSHRWIGTQRSSSPKWADLCPKCSSELFDWWQKGRSDA